MISLTKRQATEMMRSFPAANRKVKYLSKFDCEMVYRKGRNEKDSQIERVRYQEDNRPNFRTDKITGVEIPKLIEILTYNENNKIYVMAKSGGISLFDALSPKVRLSGKECWYLIPRDTPIPEGLIIAKDIVPDTNGHFHYSIQPGIDMEVSLFMRKLKELKRYMKVVG